MKSTHLHLLWRDRAIVGNFRTGVSLHSHTLYSEESMAFVPRYTSGVPVVGHAIRQQEQRYFARTGRKLDFSRAFWRPPLAPAEALELEKSQIEALDLDPLVSLTDHDDVQAPVLLSLIDPKTPISVEWTVPYGASFFHLGIHNILRATLRPSCPTWPPSPSIRGLRAFAKCWRRSTPRRRR